MKGFFCIYRLLKRAVQYPGVELLVPESWQLMLDRVSETSNSAELAELVRNNHDSSYILVRAEAANETALPKRLGLDEGLKLALTTQDFLAQQ